MIAKGYQPPSQLSKGTASYKLGLYSPSAKQAPLHQRINGPQTEGEDATSKQRGRRRIEAENSRNRTNLPPCVHAKQQWQRSSNFVAINKQISSCSDIEELADIVSGEGVLNAANVCNATTHLHRLLRQQHSHKPVHPRYSAPAHVSLAAPNRAAAEPEPTTTCQPLLLALTHATLDVGRYLTPDHCVRILTAHAWMKQQLHSSTQQQGCSQLTSIHNSSSSSSNELWCRMLHMLCSRLASSAATSPPEHLSRGLWACARLGYVHSGLAAAASLRLLRLVQADSSHGDGAQAPEAQPQVRGEGRSVQREQQHSICNGSGSRHGSSLHDSATLPNYAPQTDHTPYTPSSHCLKASHTSNHANFSRNTATHNTRVLPSLPDILSNLVWALGQLHQQSSNKFPHPAPFEQHITDLCRGTLPHAKDKHSVRLHQGLSTMPGFSADANTEPDAFGPSMQQQGVSSQTEVTQLVAVVQQRIALQPGWLVPWGPQRMATLMHGTASIQLACLRARGASTAATAAGVLSRPLLTSSQPLTPHNSSHVATDVATAAQGGTIESSAACLMALCHSVHALLDNHTKQAQQHASAAPPGAPPPQQAVSSSTAAPPQSQLEAVSSSTGAAATKTEVALHRKQAGHLTPQALSNMAWSLATLWSVHNQQRATLVSEHEGFDSILSRDSTTTINDTANNSTSAASTNSHTSSQAISMPTLESSPSVQTPTPPAPPAYELHAACAEAVRALARAAMGLPEGGLSRCSPQELCNLLQATADLHAEPGEALLQASMRGGAVKQGSSGPRRSRDGRYSMPQLRNDTYSRSNTSSSTPTSPVPSDAGATRSSNRGLSDRTNSGTPSLQAHHFLKHPVAARTRLSPPHRPQLPAQPHQPSQQQPLGHLPSQHQPPSHPSAPLQRTHRSLHINRQPPAVAAFLRSLFAASLQAIAPRMASFSAVDCCEVLHACAVVGVNGAGASLIPAPQLPQQQLQSTQQQQHQQQAQAQTQQAQTQCQQKQQQQGQQLHQHLQRICARVEASPVEIPAGKIPILLWSMARLGLVPGQLLAYLLASLKASTTNSTTSNRNMGSSIGSVDSGCTARQTAEHTVNNGLPDTQMGHALMSLSPDRHARVVWALATMAYSRDAHENQLRQQPQGLFHKQQQTQTQQTHALATALLLCLEPALIEQVHAMDNQSLCMVLWAYASGRRPCPQLLTAAAPVLLKRCTLGVPAASAAALSVPSPPPPPAATAPPPPTTTTAAAAAATHHLRTQSSKAELQANTHPAQSPASDCASTPNSEAQARPPPLGLGAQSPSAAGTLRGASIQPPSLSTSEAVDGSTESSRSSSSISSRGMRVRRSRVVVLSLTRSLQSSPGIRLRLRDSKGSATGSGKRDTSSAPGCHNASDAGHSSTSNAQPVITSHQSNRMDREPVLEAPDTVTSSCAPSASISDPINSSIAASSSTKAEGSMGAATSDAGSQVADTQPLSAQQLAMALWAVACLLESSQNLLGASMAPLRLFRAAAPAVAQAAAASQFDAKALAMVAWAYASVQINPGERVLSCIAQGSLRAAPGMSMQGLAMVAHSLAQLSYSSPQLYASLAAAMLSKGQAPPAQPSDTQIPIDQPRPVQPHAQPPTSASMQPSPWPSMQLPQLLQLSPQGAGHVLDTDLSRDTNLHRSRSSAAASLSSMALVLACMSVPCPRLMDAAVAATLASAPPPATAALSPAAPAAPSATYSSSPAASPAAPVLSPAQKLPLTNSTPSSVVASGLQRASVELDSSDVHAVIAGPAQELSHGPHLVKGSVGVLELVQLLFALGRAGHTCVPYKLDALFGLFFGELRRQRPGACDLLYQQLHEQELESEQQGLEIKDLGGSQQEPVTQRPPSPGLLAMSLMACVSLRYQPSPAFLAAVCHGLQGTADQLSTHTVCELVSSLAALQFTPSSQLLVELVHTVEVRVMDQQQELLTLESLVKLAWGMACFKLYKHPLFKRAMRRALGSGASALNDRPQLLRQLLELKLLFEAERRAGGYWHLVRPCWERRVASGGADRVPEEVLVQSARLPPSELDSAVQAVQLVKSQLLSQLHALGVDDPKWQLLRQGDQACMFHFVTSRRRGRSNSWQQLQQQRQRQQQSRHAQGARRAGNGGFHELEQGGVSGVSSSHPGCKEPHTTTELSKGVSSVAFEGQRLHSAKKMAITLIAPWHLSVNAGGVPLSSAVLRDRILARKQYSVLAVRVDEWHTLNGPARRQLLLQFLFK